MEQKISSIFPFESQYIEVKGHRMHYIEEGTGDPILFLHGNPTSSYLWRNIIPHVTSLGKAIAPDLIGMGKSDKIDSGYRFFDHYEYLEAFIEKMGLKNITLVIHDWGSGLGFHYAHKHPENIKGIAFMEAIIRPMRWEQFPAGFKMGFKLMRTPYIGWFMVSVMNIFVRQIMPQAIARTLGSEEKAYYASAYPTIKSRKPIRQWPCEIPIEGKPANVYQAVEAYYNWLKTSEIPKLLFYAEPGGIIPVKLAEKLVQEVPNIQSVFLGEGLHYLQEDHPHKIGEELSKWYQTL